MPNSYKLQMMRDANENLDTNCILDMQRYALYDKKTDPIIKVDIHYAQKKDTGDIRLADSIIHYTDIQQKMTNNR